MLVIERSKMRTLTFCSGLILGMATPAIADQDAQTLIQNHVAVVGGGSAFNAVTAVHRCGTIQFTNTGSGPQGEFRYETALRVPDLLVERLARLDEMLVHRGYTNGEIWDLSGASEDQTGPELLAMMEDTIHGANRDGVGLVGIADRAEIIPRPIGVPSAMSCVQIPTIPEIPVHCYAEETGFLTYLVRGESIRQLSDWREVGDIQIPFVVTQSEAGQVVYEVTLQAVQVNSEDIADVANAMRLATAPSSRMECNLSGQ